MNENLNLCEILKNCPKNTNLYCTFLGDVTFQCIEEDRIIIKSDCGSYSFLEDGTFNPKGECVLFPSREQRDWNKFKASIERFDPKTLKPFDKVLVRGRKAAKWEATFFRCLLVQSEIRGIIDTSTISWRQCIPYNNDNSYLANTCNDCSEYYKWWEE